MEYLGVLQTVGLLRSTATCDPADTLFSAGWHSLGAVLLPLLLLRLLTGPRTVKRVWQRRWVATQVA